MDWWATTRRWAVIGISCVAWGVVGLGTVFTLCGATIPLAELAPMAAIALLCEIYLRIDAAAADLAAIRRWGDQTETAAVKPAGPAADPARPPQIPVGQRLA